MLKVKTKNKTKYIVPEIIIVRGKMYSPKVVLTGVGNQLMLESVVSIDETEEKVKK